MKPCKILKTWNNCKIWEKTGKGKRNQKRTNAAIFSVNSESEVTQKWNYWKLQEKHRVRGGLPLAPKVQFHTKTGVLKFDFYVSRRTFWTIFFIKFESLQFFPTLSENFFIGVSTAFYVSKRPNIWEKQFFWKILGMRAKNVLLVMSNCLVHV